MDDEILQEVQVTRQKAIQLSGLIIQELDRKDISVAEGFMACSYVIVTVLAKSPLRAELYSNLMKFLSEEMEALSKT